MLPLKAVFRYVPLLRIAPDNTSNRVKHAVWRGENTLLAVVQRLMYACAAYAARLYAICRTVVLHMMRHRETYLPGLPALSSGIGETPLRCDGKVADGSCLIYK